MHDYMLRVSNVYTSLRQSSEWGMCALQGSFPRCKKRLPGDFRQRRLVLESIFLIHNFRTDIVGSNQIKTVFDPEERYSNLDGTIALASIICDQRTLTLIVTIVKTIFSNDNY